VSAVYAQLNVMHADIDVARPADHASFADLD
jgi:hypothetical protein